MSTKPAALHRKNQPFAHWHGTLALGTIAMFFGVMVAWGSLAPLGSAVVAPGIVSVESHRRAIQHLEGGIVGRLLVNEGTQVNKDDVVIELRDVAAAAAVDRIKAQYFEALANVDRLASERDGFTEIAFSPEVQEASREESVRNAMNSQRKIFESRRLLQDQKLAVLTKRGERLIEEKAGLKEQLKAVDQQIALRKQEYADAASLLDKQLIRKSSVVDIQRNMAQVEERRSGLQSSSLQVEQQIIETELRKSELVSASLAAIDDELRSRQARAHELSRELVAAQDILSRTKIRSPINGTVVGLQVKTRGAVISPGQLLMEIVPLGDDLVIEARVRPEDIEEVRVGLPALVMMNTLTRRSSQPIKGTLENVSADRLLDKLTGRAYYLVRIALDPVSLSASEAKPVAGMSADVFVQTGERTPLAYLAAPIVRSFHRGMREN
jgi:HlyD family type I secretion membrane fusion protein